MKLTVNLGENSYPIYIENNILNNAGAYISSCFSGKKIMIISDDNVFPLYGEQLKTSLYDYEVHELVLPHGEPTKAFGTLPTLYNALLKQKFSRSDLIIALGGGVIGDLAGFAAASYLAEKIVHGTEEDKEAYLTYLKAGSSDYPLEVIKKAGVDMTNTDYLDAAFKVFEDRLVELEDLVEKGVHLS